jgi:hypothetical protein
MNRLFPLTLAALCLAGPASAQITSFQHIIVVIQENRSPDNFFQGLCPTTNPSACSTAPSSQQYNILIPSAGWPDKTSKTGKTIPHSTPYGIDYDVEHSHLAFTQTCGLNSSTGACRMDGAAAVGCLPHAQKCPPKKAYAYVDSSTGVLDPYLALVAAYGWGNSFFSRPNRGPASPGINTCLQRRRLRRRMTITRAFSCRGILAFTRPLDAPPSQQRACL